MQFKQIQWHVCKLYVKKAYIKILLKSHKLDIQIIHEKITRVSQHSTPSNMQGL